LVESQAEFGDEVVGDVGVDFAWELDEGGVEAVLGGFGSEVEGVDGDGVCGERGGGIVGKEAEGFGWGRGDELVNMEMDFVRE
ncbi:hypothetical protein, partial [Neisseria sicca]|uniref:hypothetical protein n=1 Tax=Neisseria sicca TaxID=490 RepID=UPI001C99D699